MLEAFAYRTLRGVAVYSDDDPDQYATFYLVPTEPAFGLDARGLPQIRLTLYRQDANSPADEDGAWLSLATVLAVDDPVREAIRGDLAAEVAAEAARRGVAAPAVTLLEVPVVDATAQLTISGPGVKVMTEPFRPAKYGRRLAVWNQPLTPGGAAAMDKALRGVTTSSIQISYTLTFQGALPPLTVVSTFHAETFYRYVQDVDIDWDLWGEDTYRRSVSQRLTQSDSTTVVVDRRGLVGAEWDKVVDGVKDWAQRSLEKSIEKKLLLQIAPPTADETKVPDGIDTYHLDVSQTNITSFSFTYNERSSVLLDSPAPNVLPALAGLRDRDGNPLRPDDFITEVTPLAFFQKFRVNVTANADFTGMPLYSVEVRLTYAGQPMLVLSDDDTFLPDLRGEVAFRDENTVARFVANVVSGVTEYTYSYTVNYLHENTKLEAGPFTASLEDAIQAIGVSDAGILDVAVHAGSIDFTTVASAHVTLSYEDQDAGVDHTETAFDLTETDREHRWQQVIFKPRRRPYRYAVQFTTKDGDTIDVPEQEARGDHLYIDDPFTRRRSVAVRAGGDLDTVIANIGVELTYRESSGYVVREYADLNAVNPFFDWTFPVIAEETGEVSYAGAVKLRNGRTITLPPTVVPGGSVWIDPEIVPGSLEPAALEVEVLADLVDFTLVRMVKVGLRYDDGALHSQKDLIFRETASQSWKVDLGRANGRSYAWSATFYLADGNRRSVGPTTTDEPTIVLELPAA